MPMMTSQIWKFMGFSKKQRSSYLENKTLFFLPIIKLINYTSRATLWQKIGWDLHFIKKRLWHSCFPVKFAKFLRTPFFTERLRWLRPATLLKKRLWHRHFPVKFQKFLRIPFLQNVAVSAVYWLPNHDSDISETLEETKAIDATVDGKDVTRHRVDII